MTLEQKAEIFVLESFFILPQVVQDLALFKLVLTAGSVIYWHQVVWVKRQWCHRRGEGRCRAQLCTCCGSRCRRGGSTPASARSPVTTSLPLPAPTGGRLHLCVPGSPAGQPANGILVRSAHCTGTHTLGCTLSAKGWGQEAQLEFAAMR